MESEQYSYELTETAEAEVEDAGRIVVLRVVYNRGKQDTVLNQFDVALLHPLQYYQFLPLL